MAYTTNFYNPYGPQQFQPTLSYQNQFQQQPINGLIRVDGIEGAQMYQLPPNSVSPPLFMESENSFFIKTTDGGGAATVKKYTFEEAQVADPTQDMYVTREYFDEQINNIMEAINGKHSIPSQSAASREHDIQAIEEDPVVGSVQRGFQSDV